MKRSFSLLSFLSLAAFLPLQLKADLPFAECTACHSGVNAFGAGLTLPTANQGFRHAGWNQLFTTMKSYSSGVLESDRTTIVNYLEANFPIASPSSMPTGTQGAAYSQTMTGIGGTASYTWSVSGQPSGLNISAGGVLSGTPTVSGSFTLTFTITDSSGLPLTTVAPITNVSRATTTRSLTINLPPPSPTITGPASLSAGTAGVAYTSVQFTATGGSGSGYTWTASGLPSGMSISTGGLLSGTPAAGSFSGSPYNPLFTVTDSASATGSANRSLTINPPSLVITGPASLSAGTVGAAYTSVQFTGSGGTGTGYTWSATGLPASMSISTGGLLSGTPAAGTQGAYNPQFKLTDSSTANVTVGRALTINPAALQITSPVSLSAGLVFAAYTAVQFTASGGTGGYTFTATGLPSGLSISTGGLLTGTPGAGSQGAYNPQFKVTDSSSANVTLSLPLTINVGTITITGPASLPSGTVGIFYNPVQFTVNGGTGSYTWSATGLPNGFNFDSGGILTGAPAVGSQGAYTPQFTVTDSSTAHTAITLPLTISPSGSSAPVISSLSPNPIFGAIGLQTIFVNGSGFQNGAGLKVHLSNGVDVTGAQLTFFSSTQLSIRADVGSIAANWTATVVNPNAQSSNVFNFTVQVAQNTTYALPQFTFGGAWYTALYFANTTNAVAHIQVNYLTNDGAPLVVPIVGFGSVSSQSIDLNPQSTVILEALSGVTNQVGWAEAVLPTGVTGYAVFRQTVAGRPDQEAVVPLTPENSMTADLTYDDILFTTAVGFVNPTNAAEIVTISTFDTNGASTGSTQITVNPRSKISDTFKNLAGLGGIAGNRGRAVFSVTSGAVSVLGLRFGGSAFTSIQVAHRPAVAETRTITYSLPQFVFSGAWYTAFYFSNPTNAPVNIPVNFLTDNGAPLNSLLSGVGSITSRTVALNPGATAILEFLADSTNTVVQGWVEATLPPGVTGYAVFRQTVPGRPDQEAVVPLTSESAQTADLVYDDILFTTAVALLNPSDQQTTVSMTAYSANGVQIGFAQIPLAPHTKVAPVLKNVPGLASMSGNRGWVTFSVPNGDVSILGLRFGGSAFTSIPVLHR